MTGGRRFAEAGLMRRGGARGIGGATALAVDAGADSAVWANGSQTLAPMISGGSGNRTILWSIQSGTGAISDTAIAAPTFTPDAPQATVTLRITVTDNVTGEVVADDITLACTFAAVVTAGTGFTRRWWFECSDGTVTRNGSSLVSQVDDRWGNAWHMTQAGADSVKALYEATAGPNSLPCVSMPGTNDHVFRINLGIASGSRPCRFAVLKPGATNSRVQVLSRIGNTVGSGTVPMAFQRSAGGAYLVTTCFELSSEVNSTATTPALADAWCIAKISYRSTALHWQIDGADVDPQPAGNSPAAAIGTIAWGHTTAAGGSVAADICVDSPSAALEAFIYEYLAGVYAL